MKYFTYSAYTGYGTKCPDVKPIVEACAEEGGPGTMIEAMKMAAREGVMTRTEALHLLREMVNRYGERSDS